MRSGARKASEIARHQALGSREQIATPMVFCATALRRLAAVAVDIELVSRETDQHPYLCPLCDHDEVQTAPRWREAG